MIFTNSPQSDFYSIMVLIDAFSEKRTIVVKEDELFALTQRLHIDFPCKNGLKNANVFKKASAFLCEFIVDQMVDSIDCEVNTNLKKIPNYESAIIGFYIITSFLDGATVGKGKTTNPIGLSEHSYIDIIDAIHDVTLNNSFRLVAVLLEQIVYKTNVSLQQSLYKLM